MTPMPRLWAYLTQDWLGLPPDLARSWWFSLAYAWWSEATAWRETFATFNRQSGVVTPEFLHDYFAEAATLSRLVQLVEQLMQEKVLLGREGRKIEEALFAQATAAGQWKHERRSG